MSLILIGHAPPPLQLTREDKREIKLAIEDALDWEARFEGTGYLSQPSSDSGLPKDANEVSRRVISALIADSGLLWMAEQAAFGLTATQPSAGTLRTKQEDIRNRIAAIDSAIASVRQASQLRKGWAQIQARSMAAGGDVSERTDVAIDELRTAKTDLELELRDLTSRRSRPGKKVNYWRLTIVRMLAIWWMAQGWTPSARGIQTRRGVTGRPASAFAGVVAVLVRADARRKGYRISGRALKNLRLLQPISEARLEWQHRIPVARRSSLRNRTK